MNSGISLYNFSCKLYCNVTENICIKFFLEHSVNFLLWFVTCSDPLKNGMSVSGQIASCVDLYNFANVTEERKWVQVSFMLESFNSCCRHPQMCLINKKVLTYCVSSIIFFCLFFVFY